MRMIPDHSTAMELSYLIGGNSSSICVESGVLVTMRISNVGEEIPIGEEENGRSVVQEDPIGLDEPATVLE